MDETLLSISYFIHLVATVVWIGGLMIFTLYLWPEARRTIANPDESRQLLLRLQKRFRPVANLSLVMLLGTGMVQMSADDNYEGFLAFENTWSLAMLSKHLAFGGMIVLAIFIQFGVASAIERATLLASKGQSTALDKLLQRESRLNQIMLGLGIVVLVFTAIATAL